MFYQNSNDLVKNASKQSGHIQNSSETRQTIVNNNRVSNHQNSVSDTPWVGAGAGAGAGVISASLDFGSQFLNKVQGLFSLKEGNTMPENVVVANTVNTVKQNGENDLAQLDKVKGIMNLIQKQDENTRKQWAQVTDTSGISLYGYITQNGIFQVWDTPQFVGDSNWLDTDKMKNNAGVIGCPKPETFKKYNVAGKWQDYKMFDLVYKVDDTAKANPLFMITAGIRDPRNSYNRNGYYSCGSEGMNVYVNERPSVPFEMQENGNSAKNGCYIFDDSINDSELRNRGFLLQTDLTNASIAQCKRRAEDMGKSLFLLTPPTPGSLPNTGRCWLYKDFYNKPEMAGLMKLDETGNACHKLANIEDGEDQIMQNYTTTDLPRMYGKTMSVPDPDKPLPNPDCDHTTRSRCIFDNYHHKGNGRCVPVKNNNPRPDEDLECSFWARIGECAKNPGYMLYHCQTSCKNTDAWKNANIENEVPEWTYEDLYKYTKDKFKGWLGALHERNGSGIERDAVNKYINKCKGTKGYTFLDDKFVQPTKTQVSAALYSLKARTPSGLDLGPVGKIAYIDHNGERHNYPESALSYLTPGTYVEMKGYDTRSPESSYGIDDTFATNKFPPLGSMSKWEMNIEFTLTGGSGWRPLIGDMYNNVNTGRGWGVWISPSNGIYWLWRNNDKDIVINVGSNIKYNLKIINNEQAMTFVLLNLSSGNEQTDSFYKPSGATMSTNGPVTIGGWMANKNEKFVGTIHSVKIPGMYLINNPSLGEEAPLSSPIPVAKIITTTNEQCRQLCDANQKCGGYVYTKGATDTDGKCELKDREKMFPNGLRIMDPTKQLFTKVPTINSTIKDENCITANQSVAGASDNGGGVYKVINSAEYSNYPDGGAMTPDFKCNIKSHIPEGPQTIPVNFSGITNAVQKAEDTTKENTARYKNEMTITAPPVREGFKEGLDNYADTISGVAVTLRNIAGSKYQRERLLAITEESNKNLISESYKFILWSILAILAVLALLKLKEMFGQEDADQGDGGGDAGAGGGGLLATILGWFGVGSIKTDDIPDRTEEVKAALSSAGNQLKETGEQLSNSITEGADNLVKSANEAAAGAVEGATNLVDKAKETASNAIDRIGTATSAATGAATGAAAPPPSTGGKSRNITKTSRKK